MTFQELLFALQVFWAKQGCAIIQPYDKESCRGQRRRRRFVRTFECKNPFPANWEGAFLYFCGKDAML